MEYFNTQRKYLLHIDADAFFVSCEQSVDIHLKRKAVVVGGLRGVCTALSYEAKALGIKRGMSIYKVRTCYPRCIILPGNYKLYSLISKRMFEIVRRFTEDVEEYSIDECFADITGLDFSLKKSYEEIAKEIKKTLDDELGVTFSVGLASTKVLAKVGSNWDKPSGCVFIKNNNIKYFLEKLPVSNIWGIGKSTSKFLHSKNIKTAYEFTQKKEKWVEENLAKPYKQIWYELRGCSVLSFETEVKKTYQSISKTKTFNTPSKDIDFLFSELSRNIENACIKARRYNLTSNKIEFFLKRQDFTFDVKEIRLPVHTSTPSEIISCVSTEFSSVYKKGVWYRTTGIVLKNLGHQITQKDLFGNYNQAKKKADVFNVVDTISKKFGKNTVYISSSLYVDKDKNKRTKEHKVKNKNISIPIIGTVN